ncbi:hypothetical protein HPB51_020414 [Rhipicephalus microplus]|uniref:Uncharacterized protein n=1 Tax=Rhipicephalus microplus TaxID=6941 RepID=A0A9J6DWM1_RHIMP|nr:hypothetical protein HPB51_020414 [Rhipicephalus microplus]
MKNAQENKAFAQAVPLADLPPVSQNAEVDCHVSVIISKRLQSLKVCKEQLNGINVAQTSKYTAVLSNCCAIPTVAHSMPAPVHPSLAVPVTVMSSMEQLPSHVPQQVAPSTCFFAFCAQMSKLTSANVPPKVHKDCLKKKWSTPSHNALQSTSKSHFSNSDETTSKFGKSSTTLGSFNHKKQRKEHKHKEDWQMHSPKYSSKKASTHIEPLDNKLTISSNMTAISSGQSRKKDQFPHEMKPPPCPVMTRTANSDESPSEERVPAHDPADLVDAHTLPSCAHEASAQPSSRRPQIYLFIYFSTCRVRRRYRREWIIVYIVVRTIRVNKKKMLLRVNIAFNSSLKSSYIGQLGNRGG